MARLRIEALPVGKLDKLTQVHNAHAIGDVLHNGKVMSNEQIGGTKLILQVLEKVEYLCLNGHVECRNGLVADDELRTQMNARVMPIRWRWPPENFAAVVAVDMLGVKANHVKQPRTRSRRSSPVPMPCGWSRARRQSRRDGHTRIQARIRILEDELHIATHVLEFFAMDAMSRPLKNTCQP